MSAALDHPLSRSLHDAALGNFPKADRSAEVGGPLVGPCDAVAFFANHVVVAADLDELWVLDHLGHQLRREPNDPSRGLAIFLGALYERLGHPPTYASLLTVAPYRPTFLHGHIEDGGEVDPGWVAYRTGVHAYRYRSPLVTGSFAIGRGPGERWDVYIQVEDYHAPSGQAGRELLTAAKTVVPEHGLLYGSAPLHDPGVLRTLLQAGFQPICSEVLFLTRPKA